MRRKGRSDGGPAAMPRHHHRRTPFVQSRLAGRSLALPPPARPSAVACSRRLLRRGLAIAAGAEGGGVLLVRAAMVEHHPPEKEHLPEVAPVGAKAGRTVAAPAFLPTSAGKLGTMLRRARKREHVSGAGEPIGRQVERI